MAVLLDFSDLIVGTGDLFLQSQVHNEGDNNSEYIPLHKYLNCNWFAVEYYGSSFVLDSPALVHHSNGQYVIHKSGKA